MLLTDQLFQLNLPSFDQIVLPTFKGFNDDHLESNYLTITNLSEIIKSEYLCIAGIEWKRMNYFKKSNFAGSIHRDPTADEHTIFCINWVSDGDGTLDFWDYSEVFQVGYTPGAYNTPSFGVVPKYFAKTPPCKSYSMYKNCSYLVNASLPHRAAGTENRKVYSLRSSHTELEWETVIKLFKNYIIS